MTFLALEMYQTGLLCTASRLGGPVECPFSGGRSAEVLQIGTESGSEKLNPSCTQFVVQVDTAIQTWNRILTWTRIRTRTVPYNYCFHSHKLHRWQKGSGTLFRTRSRRGEWELLCELKERTSGRCDFGGTRPPSLKWNAVQER